MAKPFPDVPQTFGNTLDESNVQQYGETARQTFNFVVEALEEQYRNIMALEAAYAHARKAWVKRQLARALSQKADVAMSQMAKHAASVQADLSKFADVGGDALD